MPDTSRKVGLYAWTLVAVAMGVLLLISVGAASCRSAPIIVPTPAPTASPTPMPTATPVPTPTPVSTPQTAPVATAVPDISQDEAQAIVHAWFDAVLAQDYRTASDLTVGDATDRTRELSEGFQRATQGNAVQLTGQRLDLSPGPPQSDGSQAVKADFDIQVNAQVGPLTVGVQRLTGSATFFAGRVGDRTRITDIRDVSGLPIAQ